MKIAENAGLSQKLEKLLKPIINFLFPNAGQNAKKYIAVNMSANILGMGNAATPMGIKADLDFFIHRRIYCFNTDKITI